MKLSLIRSQNGLSLPGMLLVVAVIVAAAIGWKYHSDQKRKEEDIAQEAARKERTISECHTKVSFLAKYRSKVRFAETNITTKPGSDNVLVLGIVDMMNAFGAMIPHNYMCTFDSQGLSMLEDPFLMAEGTSPADMARDIVMDRYRK